MSKEKIYRILSIIFSVIGIIFIIISMSLTVKENIYLQIALISILISNIFNLLRNKNKKDK